VVVQTSVVTHELYQVFWAEVATGVEQGTYRVFVSHSVVVYVVQTVVGEVVVHSVDEAFLVVLHGVVVVVAFPQTLVTEDEAVVEAVVDVEFLVLHGVVVQVPEAWVVVVVLHGVVVPLQGAELEVLDPVLVVEPHVVVGVTEEVVEMLVVVVEETEEVVQGVV